LVAEIESGRGDSHLAKQKLGLPQQQTGLPEPIQIQIDFGSSPNLWRVSGALLKEEDRGTGDED
jgi:hypothetical protein